MILSCLNLPTFPFKLKKTNISRGLSTIKMVPGNIAGNAST